MRFSDLLSLPYDESSAKVDLGAIMAELPGTPSEVVRQFYSDHGRNGQFQEEYGSLDISAIRWDLRESSAAELCAAEVHPPFRRWFDSVGERVDFFRSKGWSCVDVRTAVARHWEERRTWCVPPVFLAVTTERRLRLVEGHTRLGLLTGLVREGVLAGNSRHGAWIGNPSF